MRPAYAPVPFDDRSNAPVALGAQTRKEWFLPREGHQDDLFLFGKNIHGGGLAMAAQGVICVPSKVKQNQNNKGSYCEKGTICERTKCTMGKWVLRFI